MFSWKITKYNPKNRDSSGIYLDKDEWTSYSDIGTTIHNNIFTYQKYLAIEDAYVPSIILFMECNALEQLHIAGLEKTHTVLQNDPNNSEEMKKVFDAIQNRLAFDQKSIAIVARLVLREKLWCTLQAKDMFVHFGWDYYMYIGSTHMCDKAIAKIKAFGLFVEEYRSPYLD